MKELTASQLLERARQFEKARERQPGELLPLNPLVKDSPTIRKILDGGVAAGFDRARLEDRLMRMKNLGQILTPEQLAERLQVSVGWIYEKRRPRCAKPIPAIPMGRTMRFDWEAVVKWLEELAADDARDLQQRRTGAPVRKASSVRHKKISSQSTK